MGRASRVITAWPGVRYSSSASARDIIYISRAMSSSGDPTCAHSPDFKSVMRSGKRGRPTDQIQVTDTVVRVDGKEPVPFHRNRVKESTTNTVRSTWNIHTYIHTMSRSRTDNLADESKHVTTWQTWKTRGRRTDVCWTHTDRYNEYACRLQDVKPDIADRLV